MEFEKELASILNKHGIDNACATPDFILAAYLNDCLAAYRKSVCWAGMWHSQEGVPAQLRQAGPPLDQFRA